MSTVLNMSVQVLGLGYFIYIIIIIIIWSNHLTRPISDQSFFILIFFIAI